MQILFCPLKLMCDRLSITSIICFLSIRNLDLPLNERMNRTYHAGWLKYSNGTNEIIDRGEKFLAPTNICFWKDPSNIVNTVRTRFQLKNEPIVHWKTINSYFDQRATRIINNSLKKFEEKAIEIIHEEKNGIVFSLGSKRSKKRRKLPLFLLLLLVWSFILIVNNGNILTDGRDERIYLQRRYAEM